MNNRIKRVLYSEFLKKMAVSFFSLFYDKKYLSGKFFDEQRYGFVWAWKGLRRCYHFKKLGVTWPVRKDCRIPNGRNMFVDPSSLNIFQQPGCYFQNYHGKIFIGKNVWIAQNVGIITENHDPTNPELHLPPEDVHIGDGCWIGMNSVILPGVNLGAHTTVGAGSIVTHSFAGNCVVAGNPAKIIKNYAKSVED